MASNALNVHSFNTHSIEKKSELALFSYTQPLITKREHVGLRQQAHQKTPHSTTNNQPGEYLFWTISIPSLLPGFLFNQSYLSTGRKLYVNTVIIDIIIISDSNR